MEALVPPENLPPLECLPADAARVSAAGVGDGLLKPPNAVFARGEAADAVAVVEAVVPAEVFGQRPTRFVVSVVTVSGGALKPRLRFGRSKHVHQLYGAGTRQLVVGRSTFQFHVEVVLSLLWRVGPFPNLHWGRGHRSVSGGRTVGGALGGADTDLLRLCFNGRL